MRYLAVALLFTCASIFVIPAQSNASSQTYTAQADGALQANASPQSEVPPQTARQALLEMFTGKAAGSFEKHLPEAARKALLKGGDATSSPMLREFAIFRTGMPGGEQLQTFDNGPILLTFEESRQHKAEVIVERDDLLGDEDEIELSFRTYKDGQLEPLPVRPRLTFTMKEEKKVWTLNEITLAAHIPLADPDYLKDVQKMENESNENMAIANVRMVAAAETSYNAAYPERGFTCKLSELGMDGGETKPGPQRTLMIDAELAGGKKNGYVFKIGGCDAKPSSQFHVMAEPTESDSGMRTFCASESGEVRYVREGNGEACLSEGVPLQ